MRRSASLKNCPPLFHSKILICAALQTGAVQGADIITYREPTAFSYALPCCQAQINALCLYQVLLFKLHPFRKPHRGDAAAIP